MKQLKLYKLSTWILLILNLCIVGWVFLKKNSGPPRGPKDGKKQAIDILKLDQQQNDAFLRLASQHMNQMKDLDAQQRTLLYVYFKNVFDTDKVSNSDSLLNNVQHVEMQKIESTFQHFKDIKSLLSTDQHAHFEEFMEHALEMILSKRKKNPPPPKEK